MHRAVVVTVSVLVAGCRSRASEPIVVATKVEAAKLDAAQAAPKASSPKLTPLPIVEPPTAESAHAELARVFEQWSNPDTREALYEDEFERAHFLDGEGFDAKPDRKTWFAKVLRPVEVRGLASVGCWMEPGSHHDWVEKGQCRISFWYDRRVGEAELPHDSGSWQLTLERADGGTWRVVKDRMTSRTRFDFKTSGGSLFSCDASGLGKALTVKWSSVDLRAGSRVLFTLTDAAGVQRVVDVETRSAPCRELPGGLLTVRCGTIDVGITTETDTLIVKRSPREEGLADDVRVALSKGAKVLR